MRRQVRRPLNRRRAIQHALSRLGMQAKPPWPKWPGDVYGWVAQLVYDANGQVTASSYRNGQFMYDDAT